MKIRKILTASFAVLYMMTVNPLNVAAEETAWGYINGDINSSKYRDYMSNLKVYKFEENIKTAYNEEWTYNPSNKVLLHIYSYNNMYNDLYFEFAYPDNTREIQIGTVGGLIFHDGKLTVSKDEMNYFLLKNNFKEHVKEIGFINDDIGYVNVSSESSNDDYIKAIIALINQYGLKMDILFLENEAEYFKEICGDANGDDKLDIRDAAFISNMIAHNMINKLPNNSDFNMDGKKDVRDVAQIANFLVKKN